MSDQTIPINDFTVPAQETIPGIGRHGTREVRALRHWLFDEGIPPSDSWTCRRAPSIITRSEALLFGLSMPRFALRVYLDQDQTMFVNTRRTASFCDQARGWGTTVDGNVLTEDKRCRNIIGVKMPQRPAWLLRDNRSIADSLLRLPDIDKWRGFEALAADLGHAYGEGRQLSGIPYVMHTKLTGGGLCAQAVCFMATALLHGHAKAVWGCAEITNIAFRAAQLTGGGTSGAGPAGAEKFLIGGLTPEAVAAYFSDDLVGLNAIWQVVAPLAKGSDQSYPRSQHELFGSALRAYVQSGMPVILPLDLARMAGRSSAHRSVLGTETIFQTNKLDPRKYLSRRGGPHRHAVVVVGCGPRDDETFLINDPATMPCLKASADQLSETAIYQDREMRHLFSRWHLPVTPAAVRMPLNQWCDRDRLFTDGDSGLYRLAEMVATHPEHYGQLMRIPPPSDPGIFRLTMLKSIAHVRGIPETSPEGLREALDPCGRMLTEDGWGPDHWIWLQIADRAFAVWDAEADLPRGGPPSDPTDVLLATYDYQQRRWRPRWKASRTMPTCRAASQPEAQAVQIESGDSPTNGLQKSLITSFAVNGIDAAMCNWPEDLEVGECYCFLQEDAEQLMPMWALWRNLGNIDLLREWSSQFLRWTVPAAGWNVFRAFRPKLRGVKQPGRRGLGRFLRRQRTFSLCMPIVSALDRMSAGCDSVATLQAVAKSIDVKFSSGGVKIAALATFMPEIIAVDDSARRASRAMLFLLRLGEQLRAKGHPIHTIEIVGGSRIVGLWRGRQRSGHGSRAGDIYGAVTMGVHDAVKLLLDRLRPLGKHAANADIQFSVELEPGPLFALSDQAAIEILCDELLTARYESISPLVGLNLDVAHWELAGLTPQAIPDEACKRIIHAHISDHGSGHFGDVPIGQIHPDSHFVGWLQFLRHALSVPRDRRYPTFRGAISVELEACRERGDVDASLRKLDAIRSICRI